MLHATQRLGFRVKRIIVAARDCASLPLPLLVQVNVLEALSIATHDATDSVANAARQRSRVALVTAADIQAVVVFYPGSAEPQTLSHAALDADLGGGALLFAPRAAAPKRRQWLADLG